MPTPRQLPPGHELIKLREKRMTYAQIAEEYGVTEGAVYQQLRNVGATKGRGDHKRVLPWTVKAEHAQARPAVLLRLFSRRAQGDVLPEGEERRLDDWLDELERADVVVCYHRGAAPNPAYPAKGGFYYSKRRPEDGPFDREDGTTLIRASSDTDPLPRSVDPAVRR